MPITYTDRELTHTTNIHPALRIVNTEYTMTRYAKDGNSVFHWDEAIAMDMFQWYVKDYKPMDIYDEFGERMEGYKFRALIADSYYTTKDGVSAHTIEETWEIIHGDDE